MLNDLTYEAPPHSCQAPHENQLDNPHAENGEPQPDMYLMSPFAQPISLPSFLASTGPALGVSE